MSNGMGRLVRARVDDTEDRISQLPNVLLTHILSRLPVKTAVRTSVLSRRWYPVWESVPSLELTVSDFLPRGISLLNRVRRQAIFFYFVQKILRRNRPCFIQKLRLHCPVGEVPTEVSSVKLVWSQLDPRVHGNQEISPIRFYNLESWIVLAEGYKVRHLSISSDEDMLLSRLRGSNFYKFENLVSLKLMGFMVLHIPVSSIIFPKLKILHLIDIEFKDNYSLSHLINSCCPVLDDLLVYSENKNVFRPLVICAKTLTRLHLEFLRLKSSSVLGTRIDVPALKFLSLQDVLITDNHVAGVLGGLDEAKLDISSDDDLFWLMRRIRNVKTLTLSESTLMSLDCCTLPIFQNLTYIVIQEGDDAYPSWEVLFNILKNSPILEDLYLEELPLFDDWMAEHDIPRCLTTCLKTIEVNFIYGIKRERQILGYFLKHSQVLQKMELLVDKTCTKTEKFRKNILALPKGSPECDVIIMSTS